MNKVDEIVETAIKKVDIRGFEDFFKYTEMSIEEKIAATDELIRRIREKELKTRHGEFMDLLSINKEAKKALKPNKPTTKKHGNYIVAKYRGFDAETGERIEVGELIRYCEVNGGWVKADNY
ncbi:hypothetical protein EMG21_28135 [Klebsiella pneumoniae]|nr:hypothetical protein EMG21_28135 [Klebsiella pneumoniae]